MDDSDAERASEADDFGSLPFVRDVPSGPSGRRRIVWSVKPTGDESIDFATGVEYALAFLEFEARHIRADGAPYLGRVLHAMARTGDNSAIVSGFASVLADAYGQAIRQPGFLEALRRRQEGPHRTKLERPRERRA